MGTPCSRPSSAPMPGILTTAREIAGAQYLVGCPMSRRICETWENRRHLLRILSGAAASVLCHLPLTLVILSAGNRFPSESVPESKACPEQPRAKPEGVEWGPAAQARRRKAFSLRTASFARATAPQSRKRCHPERSLIREKRESDAVEGPCVCLLPPKHILRATQHFSRLHNTTGRPTSGDPGNELLG